MRLPSTFPVWSTPHPRTSTASVVWAKGVIYGCDVLEEPGQFSGNLGFQRHSTVSPGLNTVMCYLDFVVRVFPQSPLHLLAVLFHFTRLKENV